MLPTRKEKIKWSSELAYVLGLIATDGCLSSDGRHINFTSKDMQLLSTFKNCLGLDNKIGFKTSGFSKKTYPHVQFSDVVFYEWLLKIGLTPHKSKTIGALKVPNKYFFDFLRGCFDGDGSCYSYWDRRWKNSFMFYINFNSGSLSHIKWLRAKLDKFLKISGSIKLGRGAWQLNFAKKESKIIISKMYFKKDVPCLKRKYEKLKTILKTDDKKDNNL